MGELTKAKRNWGECGAYEHEASSMGGAYADRDAWSGAT